MFVAIQKEEYVLAEKQGCDRCQYTRYLQYQKRAVTAVKAIWNEEVENELINFQDAAEFNNKLVIFSKTTKKDLITSLLNCEAENGNFPEFKNEEEHENLIKLLVKKKFRDDLDDKTNNPLALYVSKTKNGLFRWGHSGRMLYNAEVLRTITKSQTGFDSFFALTGQNSWSFVNATAKKFESTEQPFLIACFLPKAADVHKYYDIQDELSTIVNLFNEEIKLATNGTKNNEIICTEDSQYEPILPQLPTGVDTLHDFEKFKNQVEGMIQLIETTRQNDSKRDMSCYKFLWRKFISFNYETYNLIFALVISMISLLTALMSYVAYKIKTNRRIRTNLRRVRIRLADDENIKDQGLRLRQQLVSK